MFLGVRDSRAALGLNRRLPRYEDDQRSGTEVASVLVDRA